MRGASSIENNSINNLSNLHPLLCKKRVIRDEASICKLIKIKKPNPKINKVWAKTSFPIRGKLKFFWFIVETFQTNCRRLLVTKKNSNTNVFIIYSRLE